MSAHRIVFRGSREAEIVGRERQRFSSVLLWSREQKEQLKIMVPSNQHDLHKLEME